MATKTKAKTEGEGGEFILLVGQHIQADHEWEPSDEDKENAKTLGRPLRAPSKVYRAGETVPCDYDLVETFGHQKFAYKGGRPKGKRGESRTEGDSTPRNQAQSASVAPGGQVSTGHQQSTSIPEGKTVSGPMTDAAGIATRKADASAAEKSHQHQKPLPANLDSMPVAELKRFAEDEEIDTGTARSKEELVRAIRGSRSK